MRDKTFLKLNSLIWQKPAEGGEVAEVIVTLRRRNLEIGSFGSIVTY